LVLIPHRELSTDHPQLLFNRADNLCHHVLRRTVKLAESFHPESRSGSDAREPVGKQADRGTIFDCTWFHSHPLVGLADSVRLAVRPEPDRYRALGNAVSQIAPRIDHLVQLLVKRSEHRTDHAPVDLLTQQAQINKIRQRRLQIQTRVSPHRLWENGQVAM
jgi:hypothetical protein